MRRALLASACVVAFALPARRVAAQRVFAGDPIEPATGQAYSILPGVPLVYPGPDGRFGTGDDLVDAGIIGDLDVVARTTPLLGGGIIPAPAPGVAAAPAALAGGLLGGAGTQAPFYMVFTDGAATPAAGNALLGPELDLRRALVVAYADLDGDGFIGPTSATTAADLQIRRQEALTFAGRTMAEFSGGVASGRLGLSLALPASAGGLGVVVGGGAATGATPNLYADGPWATTLLPYMIPLDQGAVVGGEPTGPLDALSLVDLELSSGSVYLPPPNDAQLGTPYAIPLDGSSLSVDLVRSVSGPPVGAGFGRAVDRSTFSARWAHVIRPVLGAVGERLMIEPLKSLAVAADGGVTSTVINAFPADLFGNATDPPPSGQTITFEIGAPLRIVAPDTDGDAQRETVTFTSPRAVTLTLDDNGASGSTALLASCAGVPCGAVAVTVGSGGDGGGALPLNGVTVRMRRTGAAARSVLSLMLEATAGASVDPATQAVTLTLSDASGAVYDRSVAAGSFVTSGGGRRFAVQTAGSKLSIRRVGRGAGLLHLTLRASGLTLPAGSTAVTVRLQIGAAIWQDSRTCRTSGSGLKRCGP